MCMPEGAEDEYFSNGRIAIYLAIGHVYCILSAVIMYFEPGQVIYTQLENAHPLYNYTYPLDSFSSYMLFGKIPFLKSCLFERIMGKCQTKLYYKGYLNKIPKLKSGAGLLLHGTHLASNFFTKIGNIFIHKP